MKKGAAWNRDEVIQKVAKHMGFTRLTGTAKEPIRAAINGAIRRGVLKYDGDMIWRQG